MERVFLGRTFRSSKVLVSQGGKFGVIAAREIDGRFIVDGDIIINPVMAPQSAPLSLVLQSPTTLWPSARVPVALEDGLHELIKRNIEWALQHWSEATGLHFPARTAADSDFLEFCGGGGCGSALGRIGGRQQLYVDGFCSRGSIAHEIGHAIGLGHEQGRLDRDEHVSIIWSNIKAENHDQFEKLSNGADSGPYDFGSLMHYASNAFAIDTKKPSIAPLKALPPCVVMGQRDGLSDGDIKAVRRLYANQ